MHGIAPGGAGHIHQVHEHLRPLDVPQERVAEAAALVRAFDQSGHVRDDKAAVVGERDDAQVGR